VTLANSQQTATTWNDSCMVDTRMLFSDRSIITMLHGIVLSGAALAGLAAALFALIVLRARDRDPLPSPRQLRMLSVLLCLSAGALWLSAVAGTYGVFPLYRVTPPKDVTDLTMYPRALLLANPNTAWLHSFAMEIKEHVPWIAAMLAAAAAFVVTHSPIRALRDRSTYRATVTLVAISLVLASWVGLLGVFVNKVAPVQ
jgi:hypothetical protein